MLTPDEVEVVRKRKAALAATPIALKESTDELYQRAAKIELNRELNPDELEQVKTVGVRLRL